MKKLDTTMMRTAILWSKESYSTRKLVGAVLAKDGRILATGYNGTIQGDSNICEIVDPNGEKEIDCPDCGNYGNMGCVTCNGTKKVRIQDKTNDFVLHAEQNVICYAARNGIGTDGCTMYITLSPCTNCAKLIAQSGIKKVMYYEKYEDTSGLDFLVKCGVICEQIKLKEDK